MKKINRMRLLPSGVVVVGGSSLIPGMVALTRREMALSAEPGVARGFSPEQEALTDPGLAVAFGVLQWAGAKTADRSSGWRDHVVHITRSPLLRWFRTLLP
ncbi:MAG: hypothetical protein HY221_00350 [Candidatus Sungbacteria bacterium]|uniref:Uncharacterized protein n=1 Tax=Candidatus Sungiibacteriota bacterium TaxID=2750080 RepID=A0A932VS39_9BACT|nr:hypothetical protein [Candidatus Sungbacteria bacterium]